jgi:hypothetical protein
VTSAKKLAVALATCAAGVPVRVTDAFCVTGAVLAALSVTVTLCPTENTPGENVAVVPAGNPDTVGVMSKSTLVDEFTIVPYWMDPDPPIGTPTSRDKGEAKKKLGTAPVLTVKLKSPLPLEEPAVPVNAKS